MARGTVALVIGLFFASALLVVGIALIVLVLGGLEDEATAGVNFLDLVWMSLLRTLDPGTMGGDAGTVVFVAGMFSATLGGLFLVAILIGLVTSGIEGKLSELRKGRSRVVERDHTVILGWSAQVYTLIEQLVEANASKRGQRIVVALAAPFFLFRRNLGTQATGTTTGIRPAFRRTRLTASHDVVDLVRINRFVLDQRLRHEVQLLAVVLEDLHHHGRHLGCRRHRGDLVVVRVFLVKLLHRVHVGDAAGAPVVPLGPQRLDRLKEARAKTSLEDAVLATHGAIDDLSIVAVVQDFSFMGGFLMVGILVAFLAGLGAAAAVAGALWIVAS